MNVPAPLVFSSLDHRRLEDLIGEAGNAPAECLALLEKKLRRAHIVPPEEMPSTVVTMNSQLLFRETDSRAEYGFRLVYPGFGRDPGAVSVLTPVGAALIGLSVGQMIRWQGRNGRPMGLQVLRIVYQPEADGEYRL